MKYDPVLMLMSLKYAKDVLQKFGKLQDDGSYILDNRVYTVNVNNVNSKPV